MDMREHQIRQQAVVSPIGIIRSPWKSTDDAPIQGAMRPDAEGIVSVYPEYCEGLTDLDGFSHCILLYWFDRAGEVRLRRAPFLDDASHGIFAMRHPARPNPIGLTVVRIVRLNVPELHIAGIDVLDGTPVIDIKPYVPEWDAYADATTGWLRQKGDAPKPPGRE